MSWSILGWLGQGFFFSRFLVQWWQSERKGRIVVPPIFWWLSLLGSFFSLIYAVVDRSPVFLAGPCVNLFIHARNIALLKRGVGLRGGVLGAASLGIALFATIALVAKLGVDLPPVWIVVGSLGQILWISRFPAQWLISERAGRPQLPPLFFLISFVGSILLLAYALKKGNPVWIAGMVPGPLLYARSLVLCRRGPEFVPAAGEERPLEPEMPEALAAERGP